MGVTKEIGRDKRMKDERNKVSDRIYDTAKIMNRFLEYLCWRHEPSKERSYRPAKFSLI